MSWSLRYSDALTVLRDLTADSIDSVVTDPPYGLKFMGKDWDRALPDPRIWVECLRVAKPGAHLLAFGHPRLYHRLACQIEDAGWELRDCLMWLYGQGFPKSRTVLKPAYEPILLARRPLIGTIAANVLKHGTGVLNVDGCRIGTSKDVPASLPTNADVAGWGFGPKPEGASGMDPNVGRWPANLILDEEAGAMLDAQSGHLKSGAMGAGVTRNNREGWAGPMPKTTGAATHASSGGASRFFYCAKARKRERGEGNKHPTVKPIALMRWLVRLVTPKGGLVLDPFVGTGTTGCASITEGLRFLGVDNDSESIVVARQRMNAAQDDLGLFGLRPKRRARSLDSL